jgi:hypothetical protein
MKAKDFIENKRYAYISAITGSPSEVGFCEVMISGGARVYYYTGYASGVTQICTPSDLSSFVEVPKKSKNFRESPVVTEGSTSREYQYEN